MGFKAAKRAIEANYADLTTVESASSFESIEGFVDAVKKRGGKLFVEYAERYGCNEKGEEIKWTDWYREYLELIGSLQSVGFVATGGASQVGKTLGHTLLMCYCLTIGKLSPLWSYDQERSLNIQVPSNFRPVVREWLKRMGIKPGKEDTQNNTLYQFQGASAQFVYVSTSKAGKSQDGTAAAGGIAVGVSRDIAFLEEKSQYPPGAADPLFRRLDAGRLPCRPVREIGTFGGGNGLEWSIARATYDFQAHFKCRSCGAVSPMVAKGCLLKPTLREMNGVKKLTYLSEIGKPLEWHHHDKNDPIDSAYFGCPKCGTEIPHEDRRNAWFQCIKTGVTLRSFLDNLPDDVPSKRITAGITLSPLLRVEKTNVAAAIVREGLETRNPDDYQQQRLGIPSETSNNSIPLDRIKQAISTPPPIKPPDYIIAGIDQGRTEDWLMIVHFYLPEFHSVMSVAEIVEKTVRQVVWGGAIERTQILDKLKAYSVQYGFIDNEPDIPDAARLCQLSGERSGFRSSTTRLTATAQERAWDQASKRVLQMADQKSQTPYDIKEAEVHAGGLPYPCWFIRQEDFLKQVLMGFILSGKDGNPLYRLPPEWEKWLSNPSERSPIRHLRGPSYDPEEGKWKRGEGNIDDLYYALMFAESAFYNCLCSGQTKTSADWIRNI